MLLLYLHYWLWERGKDTWRSSLMGMYGRVTQGTEKMV
jgi:hypothetical protein